MKNIIYIILIFAIMQTSCKSKNTTEEVSSTSIPNQIKLTEAQYKNANIELGKFDAKNISSILKTNGKIDVPPQNLISISAPLGGYLKSTKLLPGMPIRKGEVIAVLEDQQFIQLQQDYLLTKAKLHFAEIELARQKEMSTTQATSAKNVTQAEAEVKMNKILLNAYSEKLKLIHINPQNVSENNITKNVNIYAPISGYVSKVNVNIGKYIAPVDVLFELINPTDIHLNLHIFEKELPFLSIGQKVIAYNNTSPERKYNCTIILISKDVDANGITEVHCHFDNYDKSLIPGMYMNAELNIPSRKSNIISEDAVVSYEGKSYIFIAKNKLEYEMREVQTGNTAGHEIEILNGHSFDGNEIVTKGAYTLLMKLKNTEEE